MSKRIYCSQAPSPPWLPTPGDLFCFTCKSIAGERAQETVGGMPIGLSLTKLAKTAPCGLLWPLDCSAALGADVSPFPAGARTVLPLFTVTGLRLVCTV